MHLIESLHDIPSIDTPCGLTIGSFDGVHLGHQALIKRLKAALPPQGVPIVFTFSNHPTHLFNPSNPAQLICTPAHKLRLLEACGVKVVIMIPFSQEFSQLGTEEFLTLLKTKLHFSELILGEGATFGKNREGNAAHVKALAERLHFKADYISKTFLGNRPISSGRVRLAITTANFQEAALCLGREYSLYGHLTQEKEHYLLPLKNICLPPEGIYPVRIQSGGTVQLGRAHINASRSYLRIDPQESISDLQGVEVSFGI